MTMMIDVACSLCGRRFGWCGRFVDRPPCPRCGHKPPHDELEDADNRMAEQRRLASIDPSVAAGSVLRQQRVDAGLTLRQAAKKLSMAPTDLSAIEQGKARPTEQQAEAMRWVYRGMDVLCKRCEGDGKAHGSDRPFEWSGPGTYPGPCPKCHGTGFEPPEAESRS